MEASKVRGKCEVRVSTRYPNEIEDMLDHIPQCVVTNHAQVWNVDGQWMFWVRTQSEEVAQYLVYFLKTINMDYESTQED